MNTIGSSPTWNMSSPARISCSATAFVLVPNLWPSGFMVRRCNAISAVQHLISSTNLGSLGRSCSPLKNGTRPILYLISSFSSSLAILNVLDEKERQASCSVPLLTISIMHPPVKFLESIS
jgi:hypothetical protein